MAGRARRRVPRSGEAGAGHQFPLVVPNLELIVVRNGTVLDPKADFNDGLEQGGELSLGQVLRLRLRYMSDGVALGTRAFEDEVLVLHREKFGPKRKDGARPIRGLSSIGLNALRDLRARVFG